MAAVVDAASGEPRFTAVVMSVFAFAAFVLAGLGLYGVLGYAVAQRTREIGVRLAVGASRQEIFTVVIGTGMRLALIALAIGVPLALIATRLMRGTLAGVGSGDPVTYGGVAAMLLTCALLASYLPARRAMSVDPLVALRTD